MIDVADSNQLQDDIDNLVTWVNKWQVQINIS